MGDHIPYKKRHYNDLDITVTIRYQGLKATQYFSKFTDKSLANLRQDLLALKVPHPKTENVVLTSHGCIEFSWFGVEPYKLLHNNLISKLQPNTSEGQRNLDDLLKALSISSATFRAIPSYNNTPVTFFGKKRPHPTDPAVTQPPRKRFAAEPPVTPPESTAAEKFINDTLMMVKSEPQEYSLPPPPPPPKWNYDPPAHTTPRAGPSAQPRAPPSAPASYSGSHSACYRPDLPTKPSAVGANSDDAPTYKNLMKELWAVRKQIASANAREAAVIEEIKKLHPGFNAAISDANQKEITVLKVQLEEARRNLRTERKQTEELQAALDNVRNESKEPFIVPGIFDAFLLISRLAAQIR